MGLLRKKDKPKRTTAARRRNQRKKLFNRLKRSAAANTEFNEECSVVVTSDAHEKDVRAKRASLVVKKEPQTEIEQALSGNRGRHDKAEALRLVAKAERNRYDITPERRERVLSLVDNVIEDDAESTKNKLAAARIQVLADSVNAGREKAAQSAPVTNVNIGIVNQPAEVKQQRLDTIATTLGLPPAE